MTCAFVLLFSGGPVTAILSWFSYFV